MELLGTSSESIERAEDRELFKELCESLGEPVLPSVIANTVEEAIKAAENIGYPVVLRPAFTLGGTGGGFADDEQEFLGLIKNALALSPVHQVLIEKSIKGFKEIEYEVIRDANDTAITVSYTHLAIELEVLFDPVKFTGMAEYQCEKFVTETVKPLLEKNKQRVNVEAQVNV